jgi:hypothetical protein
MTESIVTAPWAENNPYPLMSEDSDWYAFPRSMTRREVVSEMLGNFADWWMDDNTTIDDDDKVHGWFGAIRAMFNATTEGKLRPADPGEYGYEDGYWYETNTGAVEAWIVRL